jgi:hypothetical protein
MRDFPVDYPETHPLVEGEFDYQHYFTYEEMVYWHRDGPKRTQI